MKLKLTKLILTTFLASLLIMGCSDDDNDSSGAQVSVRVSDSATQGTKSALDYRSIVVAIERVELHGEAGTTVLEEYGTDYTLNLVDLGSFGLVLINDAEVEEMTYNQIRLIVDAPEQNQGAPTNPNSYVVTDENPIESPLFVPSGAQTGLKINLQPNLIIEPGQSYEIHLDFNSDQSIHKTGANDRYILQPTAISATVTQLETGGQ